MKKVAILVSRGSYNSLVQVMTLVMACMVSEIKVRLFFRDESVFKLTPQEAGKINLTEFYKGQETNVIARLKQNKLENLQSLLREVKEKGDIHVAVCSSSLAICGLRHEDLIPEVDEVQGLTSFLLEEMSTADQILTF